MKQIINTTLKSITVLGIGLLLLHQSLLVAAEATNNGFFRYPHTNGRTIVFTSEGDLWQVPITGGIAVRLTTHTGEERYAKYSPDGNWIAFSGQEDGQDDVFVIPSTGGEPRRLTYHPASDQVIGWTKDGKVIFRSRRDHPTRGYRIYTISAKGGFPEWIELEKAALMSFEPQGERIAFNRYSREFRKWKRYQGGWAQDIWVGNLKTKKFTNITDIPSVNEWEGTDAFPMWHTDGRIYFLTDRSGKANIHSMRPDGEDVRQHTAHDTFDCRWSSLGGGVIVYQNGMDVYRLNIASGDNQMVSINLPSDRVQAHSKFVDPKKYITDFELSPDGSRVLFCARGELFTAPSKGKGLIRQLTHNSGIRQKSPHWMPDGSEIVFWSDDTGEEELYTISAGGGEQTSIGTDQRGWHYSAEPSPDGKYLAFSNEELELIVLEIKSGNQRIVDRGSWEIREYTWSADSRFLAYSRPERNNNNTIQIWDQKDYKVRPITDDFTSSRSPAFDPEGKYLYFLSNRTANPHLDGAEMTYILDKKTLPYVVMLRKGMASPFAPEADPGQDDDSKGNGKGKKDKKNKKKDDDEEEEEKVADVEIDFDGIASRIAAVPINPDNYFGLSAIKNKLFYLIYQNNGMFGRGPFDKDNPGVTLHRFNIKKQKHKQIARNVRGYDISSDNKKIIIRSKGRFIIQGVDEGSQGSRWKKDDDEEDDREGFDLSQWDLKVDVKAEWQQMFRESWRLQRDFFWNEKLHNVDWNEVYDRYSKLAPRVSTRDELSDLIGEVFAELNCSHTYVWGGDQRRAKNFPTGMLGIDISHHHSGFYKIDRIIEGRPWDGRLSSPLAASGVNASEGDYIIKVNGQLTSEVSNIYELLANKAGKIISLTLNAKPNDNGSREVIIKAMNSDRGLRYWDWVDGRRKYVSDKSNGQIGYIHLANMGGFGLSQFTAEYQPQHNKPALIMDVRYNGGGFVAPMILAHLARRVVSVGKPRHGSNYRNPQTAFHGHMAAVSNGETGSDGETFTEGFKRLGLGPVIGTRTWGGWVGIRGNKRLIDNGMVTQPEFTGWGVSDSEFLIEGWGTDPDIEVKEVPTAELNGRDPQLDATIDYLMDKMKNDPMTLPDQPTMPDRSGFVK